MSESEEKQCIQFEVEDEKPWGRENPPGYSTESPIEDRWEGWVNEVDN